MCVLKDIKEAMQYGYAPFAYESMAWSLPDSQEKNCGKLIDSRAQGQAFL